MDTVLELNALTKRYANHLAVDSVSFSLARGEFFSLVGPSGCGKTTTLRLIAGLETPTSGQILLNGASIADVRAYRRNINTVFQNYALFPHLTVIGNVAFGLERRSDLTKSDIKQRVKEALAMVHLTGKESRFPHQLSGGERQRTALARSLVLQPEVLLLDEPLSALDPQLRKQVRSELKALQRRVGITFLFITHDQEEALSLSDRMAVMSGGRVKQMGTPRELYETPRTRFVAEFLGEVNWLEGSGVRPEATRVSRHRPVINQFMGAEKRTVPGVVQSVTYLGHCIHLRTVLANGKECTAQIGTGDGHYQPGEAVHVWWNSADELQTSPPA